LESLCRDFFRNCPAADGPPRCYLSAQRGTGGWAIHVNGHEFLGLQDEEQLGLGLMHAARAMLYAEGAYDIAFHAAAVAYRDCAILLCAPRECGKSTLAAFLVAHGFELLADEPALLQLDRACLSALSLPISLKQGSWPHLQREIQQFSRGPVHVRSDGVKIRLAHAPAERRNVPARPLTHIVFPRYEPSSPVKAERLSALRTVEFLNEGGLLPAKNLGPDKFERFLDLLERTPAHSICYGSLREAWELLRGMGCRMPG
jgi:hypothetical protein